MNFQLLVRDSRTQARTGLLNTAHGVVGTPAFMPVATNATVKTLSWEELEEMGVQIVIANTYHLCQRPGVEVVEKAGGLHQFTGWHRVLATDSGGFQIFSLENVKISENEVVFQSQEDGSKQIFTPEKVMDMQRRLGADLVMAFDYCPRRWDDLREISLSTEVTVRWARQCRQARLNPEQWLFGIVQGGTDSGLRSSCTEALKAMDFDGYAIGGLSLGEPFEKTREIVSLVAGLLPQEKMRYFMGLGYPWQIVEMVALGIDLFDCALPTHIARNGSALTSEGKINIKAGRYQKDFQPLDSSCNCFVCRRYSRAYLRHLFNRKEILALRLTSYHNIYFMNEFMRQVRQAIAEGKFVQLRETLKKEYNNAG